MKHLQTFFAALVLMACTAQAQQIVLKGVSPQKENMTSWNPATPYQYKYRGDTAKFENVGFLGQHFAPVVKNHEEANLALQRFRDNRLAGAITGGAAVAAFGAFAITAFNSGSGDLPVLFLFGTMALGGTSYYLLHNSNKYIEEAVREFNSGRAMGRPKEWPNMGYGFHRAPGIKLGYTIKF